MSVNHRLRKKITKLFHASHMDVKQKKINNNDTNTVLFFIKYNSMFFTILLKYIFQCYLFFNRHLEDFPYPWFPNLVFFLSFIFFLSLSSMSK